MIIKIKNYFSKTLTLIFTIFLLSQTIAFSADKNYKAEIIHMVNSARAERNLPPLEQDKRLNNLADKKAKIMAKEENLSHTAGGYNSFSDLIKEAGIKYLAVGENIARNWRTPEEVMEAWLNSSGHRANIMSKKFTKIGVGKAVNSKGDIYWVQLFIKER